MITKDTIFLASFTTMTGEKLEFGVGKENDQLSVFGNMKGNVFEVFNFAITANIETFGKMVYQKVGDQFFKQIYFETNIYGGAKKFEIFLHSAQSEPAAPDVIQIDIPNQKERTWANFVRKVGKHLNE